MYKIYTRNIKKIEEIFLRPFSSLKSFPIKPSPFLTPTKTKYKNEISYFVPLCIFHSSIPYSIPHSFNLM